jgi:DNA-binding HxlR family transcriptional regulator
MAHTLDTNICTKSLKLLADFWHLRILEELATTELRYCALQRALDDVNPATLTKKLQVLENEDIIERHEEAQGHHVSYALTKKGQASLPVLSAIKTFSDTLEK